MTPVGANAIPVGSPPIGSGAPHSAVIDWANYKPRERGVLDLIDDILRHCAEDRIRFSGGHGTVTETPLPCGNPRSIAFPFRNSIFRLIMARMAALCHELSSQDVSPYGGKGSFTDPRWPHVCFQVDFMNTPAEQRLELTPVFSSEPA